MISHYDRLEPLRLDRIAPLFARVDELLSTLRGPALRSYVRFDRRQVPA